MQGSNNIKSFQLALIIFFTQTGVGVIMLPSTMANTSGHDGWISLTLTLVLVLVLCVLLFSLLRRYSGKSIYDINSYIYGNITGKIINSLLVIYLAVNASVGGSLFIYFIRITLLQRTPTWVLAPLVALPSVYLVWQGLKQMSRFLYISALNYIIIILFMAVLSRDFRPTFLMPFGEAGLTRILYGIKAGYFAFIGFELILFFYPYVTDKKKALKWYIIANLASLVFFLIIVLSSTALFGENLLKIYTLPFFSLSRVYNAPILERVDLYITALWYIPMACSIRNYVFAAYDGLRKVFGVKKTKLTYIMLFASIIIFGSIPRDLNQVLLIIEMLNYMGMGVTAFFILSLLLSFIRNKGVVSK